MMLVLSPDDFQKLSATCRSEILKLLMNAQEAVATTFFAEPSEGSGGTETEEVASEEKKVVSLTVADAGDLLANISERSSQTLRHFAAGKPVPLEALVGQGKPYKTYVELKRSFVGAVNRRLRTVSGNRNAALFSSDRDKTRIKVTPKTAQALRRVFELPEPLPAMEYCDQHGQELEPTSSACQTLAKKLDEAWQSMDSTKLAENSTERFAAVLRHFVGGGFELFVRALKSWNQDTDTPEYEIQTVIDPYMVIDNWLSEHGAGDLFVGLPGDSSTLAQPKI